MSTRVVHLLGQLRPSGMERMLVSAAQCWDGGAGDHLVVGQGVVHPFRQELEAAGYRVVTVPSLRSWGGYRSWRKLIRDENPDVVHIHSESAFVSSVMGARGRAVVRTVHSFFPSRGSSSWSRRAQALLADRRVSAFVAPSPDVAAQEQALGRECEVIYNWVASEFSEDPGGAADAHHGPWAAIVGNASPIKGHETALRAVADTDLNLAYVGSEAGASAIEVALLDNLAVQGRLLHRGPGNPLPWLQGASVFLMPSIREGMGVALAEALQVGIPAVVSDVPGLRWAAGLSGVVAIESRDPAHWHDAIRQAGALGRDATRGHPDFSAERGAREYSGVYARAVAVRSSGR